MKCYHLFYIIKERKLLPTCSLPAEIGFSTNDRWQNNNMMTGMVEVEVMKWPGKFLIFILRNEMKNCY